MKELEKHLTVILKKMCKSVGVDFDKINFKEDKWYLRYTWHEEEEKRFILWMTSYLYNNIEARKEIMSSPIKRMKFCKKAAEQFAWNYGWKVKTES